MCSKSSKISVVVPVYNSQKYLKKCIHSILDQTHKNLEVILINDGSTDQSDKICRQAADSDDRIRYYVQTNLGVSAARNKGISLLTGEYVMFVDSDDIVDSGICEKLLKSLEKHGAQQALCGYRTEYYVENHLKKRKITVPDMKRIGSREELVCRYPVLFHKKIVLSPCMKLYQAEIILENRIKFEENIELGEDILFNYEYYRHVNRVAVVNEPLYHYRVCKNSNTLTHKYFEDRINNAGYILDRSLKFAEEMGITERGKAEFARWYYKNCMLTTENLLEGKETEQIRNEIKKIFGAHATGRAAAIIPMRKDAELFLYKICFSSGNYLLFLLVVYMRILVKKTVRE